MQGYSAGGCRCAVYVAVFYVVCIWQCNVCSAIQYHTHFAGALQLSLHLRASVQQSRACHRQHVRIVCFVVYVYQIPQLGSCFGVLHVLWHMDTSKHILMAGHVFKQDHVSIVHE